MNENLMPWIPFPRALTAALLLTFVLVPAGAGPGSANDLGDLPTELKVTEWVAGKGVRLSELRDKSVCVVDFFRTWYPPCRFQLLEESAAQKDLGTGAVTFIGLTDEPAWLVQSLRDELPKDFLWHVGLDRNDSTLKALLGPGENQDPKMLSALPRTLVIDKAGRVVYFGTPPHNLRELIREVVAGTWDADRARKQQQDEKLLEELRKELNSLPSSQGDRIVALADRLAGLKISDSKAEQRSDTMQKVANKLLDESCGGKHDRQALRYAYLGAEGQPWYGGYETLAKALFRTGDLKEAVAAQKEAVSVVGDEGIKAGLRKQLAEYAEALARKTGEAVDVGDSPKDTASKPPAPESNVPPSELTSALAVEDLERLHTIILNGYAGYDDFEWKLQRAGSSWRERLKSCQEKAAGRAVWPIDEFFSLAAEFLRPIVDEHFYIALTDSEGKGFRRREKFTVRHSAFFTDLRIVASGGRMVVRSADPALMDLIGREVRQIPVVSVESAALDTPFLFPTVPESAATPEYLLGVFLAAEPSEPRPFTFYNDVGRSSDVRLALHRCRVKDPNAGKKEPWSMRASGDTPLPVLSVRTAVEDKLTDDFLKSAETLRGAAAAILDLRANGGGSDTVAMDWCGLIFPQEYQVGTGNAIVAGGKGSVSRRWNPMSLARPSLLAGPRGRNPARERFRGALFVLTDINTASSGETFAGLARQIPGAVLAGENTRGCTLYGNADIVKRLPTSRIAVRFGWTRFNWAGVFPIREGVGFFPDYWIDEADPYPALAKLASLFGRGKT